MNHDPYATTTTLPAPPPPSPPVHPVAPPDPPGPARSRTPWGAIAVTAVLTAALASAGTVAAGQLLERDDATAPAAAFDAGAEPTTEPTTEPDIEPEAQAPGPVGEVDWASVAAAVRPAVVAIAVRGPGGRGEGSGVVIDEAGHIITNDHVAGGGGEIAVTLTDGRVLEAELVGTDPTTDVAVVALTDPPDNLGVASFGDSDAVAVGDPVMAIGNPLGLDSTATTGIVSAVDRPVSTGSPMRGEPVVTNAIQIDAAINPGNSGGPLFDAAGRVIGINSSILTTSQGSGSIGLGFAIPGDLAQRVAGQLVADGSAEHAYLGVGMSDGTATADGVTRLGAVVAEVGRGTPAAGADLRPGDVVVAIDGDPVSGSESLTAHVRERGPGDEVVLTVIRGGEARRVEVTLASREQAAG